MDTAVDTAGAPPAIPELDLFRIGGMAGIAGGILAIVANALHPRLSSGDLDDTEEFLEMVADYSLWRLDHLAIIVSLALGIVAAVALARSITDLPAAAWAELALPVTLVTGGVAAAAFAIDGFVMAGVAEDWADATGAGRAVMLERAETLEYVDIALFSVTIIGLFGVAQLLFGLAFWQSAYYPNWIGSTALVAGVVGLASGAWMWMSGEIGVGNFLILFSITSVLFAVWLLAGSVLLLRRSRAPDLATLQP
jgi:hypothetical protein